MSSNSPVIESIDYFRHKKLPDQTVSTKKKLSSKEWQRSTIEYFAHMPYYNNSKRKTAEEMRHNRLIMSAIYDQNSLSRTLDPLGVVRDSENVDMPLTFYNVIEQPFNALLGEELKREFDVKAYAVNMNVINQKDEIFKERLGQYLISQAEAEETPSQEQVQKTMEKLKDWQRNDLQSAHEQMANQILQSHLNDPNMNLKETFNKGFENLNVIAEEIFRIGESGKDPTVSLVNSEDFWVHGLGDSDHIEDGIAWVEQAWLTPNKIIEEFYEDLNPSQIKDILEYKDTRQSTFTPLPITSAVESTRNSIDSGDSDISRYLTLTEDGEFAVTDTTGLNSDTWSDEYGNIRVIRVQWLSMRKVGILHYLGENGEDLEAFVDEYYEVDDSKGEWVEKIYINELWEGTKIGYDIYLRIRPHPIQMRPINNPAKVYPTYVGVIKGWKGGPARSRLDLVMEYQHLYNAWMNKLTETWTKNLGKLGVLDSSRIPSDMDPEEWFVWIKRFGLIWENPFEVNKERPDMISGNMQQNNRVVDMSLANEIREAIEALRYIEDKIDQLTAVPAPRQGEMTGNEGLGTSQQAVIQSSNQTEGDFKLHDYAKAKTLEVLLEYTKYLWKDDYGKRQYLLDDLSNYILDIDGALLSEADYGVRITNTTKSAEINTILKQLIHPAMQNGTATLSDAARAMLASSPSEMLQKLEQSEEKRIKQQQEQEQIKTQLAREQKEAEFQLEQIKHQQELEKINLEYDRKAELERLKIQNDVDRDAFARSFDENDDGVEDDIELKIAGIQQDTKKLELASKEKIEKDKLKVKQEELKSKEKIEARKAIKKVNQNS